MPRWLLIPLVSALVAAVEPRYDSLLRNGHVIDPKNGISARRDVAVKDGKIALVARRIDPA